MELKRQEKINELKYPEKAFFHYQKEGYPSKKVTLFSTLLASMLSSNLAFASNVEWGIPPIAGGLQIHPMYEIHFTLNIIAGTFQIIAMISLITTIIFTVQFLKLKNKNNLPNGNLEEKELDDKTIKVKRRKKRLVISASILGLSIIVFIGVVAIKGIIY